MLQLPIQKKIQAIECIPKSHRFVSLICILLDFHDLECIRLNELNQFVGLLSGDLLYGCARVAFFTSLIAFINAIRIINVVSYQYQVHHSYQSHIYVSACICVFSLFLWDWNDVKMWHANATACLTYIYDDGRSVDCVWSGSPLDIDI